jgi:hypothetical protein
MAALFGGTLHVKPHTFTQAAIVAVCVLATASCTSTSYQAAAMEASDAGDQKTAIRLAKKEVARFSTPDQCSRTTSFNCGTLALAYGTLAGYQILDGDRVAGERSFDSAREALSWMNVENRPSATAMVYHDVSEALWKTGDRTRAVAVFKEGRAAGADFYLFMGSAARAAGQLPADPRSTGTPPNR